MLTLLSFIVSCFSVQSYNSQSISDFYKNGNNILLLVLTFGNRVLLKVQYSSLFFVCSFILKDTTFAFSECTGERRNYINLIINLIKLTKML